MTDCGVLNKLCYLFQLSKINDMIVFVAQNRDWNRSLAPGGSFDVAVHATAISMDKPGSVISIHQTAI